MYIFTTQKVGKSRVKHCVTSFKANKDHSVACEQIQKFRFERFANEITVSSAFSHSGIHLDILQGGHRKTE